MDQREAQLEVRERSSAVRTSLNARRNAAAGSERKYDSDASVAVGHLPRRGRRTRHHPKT